MSFTLATWNINSVRLREPIVCKLLAEEAPDVLCLQECKSPVDKIPTEAFADLGYTHMVARGQKGYNGVAILSKLPMEEVGAEDFADLGHARHIAGRLENGVVDSQFLCACRRRCARPRGEREIRPETGLSDRDARLVSWRTSRKNPFWSAI